MNKNEYKKTYSQIVFSANHENHASEDPNLAGAGTATSLTSRTYSRMLLNRYVLLPLTRQQRRWKNIWHWCQPIHLLLDCQLFHLLCTSDGRSVKHHTWMICGEVKMSHGLDAKQWQGWKTLASCRLAPEQFHPLFPSAGECWPWTLECFHPPPSSCPLSKTHHLSAEKSLHG